MTLSKMTFTLLTLVLLSSCKLATIRPLDPVTGKAIIGTEEQEFSAERYVDERWQDPIISSFSNAIELNELLTALKQNPEGAAENYGRREGNSAYNFMVKGEAKVLTLDTSSRAGLLNLDLAPYDGTSDLSLAIGPVIRGTALRGVLAFIKFNDFTNQLEFADVSKALHLRVMSNVIETFDLEASVGKTIQFAGAFTQADSIIITPVVLEVKD